MRSPLLDWWKGRVTAWSWRYDLAGAAVYVGLAVVWHSAWWLLGAVLCIGVAVVHAAREHG